MELFSVKVGLLVIINLPIDLNCFILSFKSKKSIWLLSTLKIDISNNGFAAISFSDAINSSV